MLHARLSFLRRRGASPNCSCLLYGIGAGRRSLGTVLRKEPRPAWRVTPKLKPLLQNGQPRQTDGTTDHVVCKSASCDQRSQGPAPAMSAVDSYCRHERPEEVGQEQKTLIGCFLQIPGSVDQVDEAHDDDHGDARSHKHLRDGGASEG